ncbi:MAG: hypothetical protein M3326_06045 [Actinomycetota bacterium]|nr:hypothetical protein [Actinomycetota bacterium]
MGTSRTGSARPDRGRRFRWATAVAVALAVILTGACSKSEFRYVSNAKINTYLKVPSDWKVYTHDDLIGAEVDAARERNQPSSLIDMLVNREFQWRMAFDGDPRPSVEHTLTLAEEPVVEVSVRALDQEEHEQVSLAALRNVIVNYDELKQQAQEDLTGRGVGIAGESTNTFRPIDEEELHYPGGIRGVRLRYVLRPNASSPFYAFDQTTLVDNNAERLYVLLIRSGEAQFLRYNQLFTEIAKSFTVKPKG